MKCDFRRTPLNGSQLVVRTVLFWRNFAVVHVIEVRSAHVQPVAECCIVLRVVFTQSAQFINAQIVSVFKLEPALFELICADRQKISHEFFCDLLTILVADVQSSFTVFESKRGSHKSRTIAYSLIFQVVKNEFCQQMWLQVILEVTKGLIKPVDKKVSDTQLLICFILQNDFVVQVLDPGPKNVCVIQRG